MQPNNFTIIRLILATLVVFGHFKTLSGLPIGNIIHSYADFAVDVFFVVSGFLIYGSFDNSPKLKGFAIKRFFRIYPLYFIIILTQFFIMLWLLGGNVQAVDMAKYLGSNLIFANFLSPDMGGLLVDAYNPAINASLWTLKIEIMFYMLVPLIYWAVQRKGLIALVLIYIVSTIFALWAVNYGSDSVAKQLPAQLRFFVMGIGLYMCRDRFKISHLPAFIFAATLLALCQFRYNDLILPIYPLIIGALVFICVLRLPVVNLKFDISYGVYLIHAPLIQLSLLFGFFSDSYWFLASLVIIVYALAFIVEKTIELPMVKLGKRLGRVI